MGSRLSLLVQAHSINKCLYTNCSYILLVHKYRRNQFLYGRHNGNIYNFFPPRCIQGGVKITTTVAFNRDLKSLPLYVVVRGRLEDSPGSGQRQIAGPRKLHFAHAPCDAQVLKYITQTNRNCLALSILIKTYFVINCKMICVVRYYYRCCHLHMIYAARRVIGPQCLKCDQAQRRIQIFGVRVLIYFRSSPIKKKIDYTK